MMPIYTPVKRSRKLASRVKSLTVNGRDWFQRHVLLSALGTLCTIWFVVAVLAYRFEHGAEGANLTSFGDSVWWGIITLLTVGYGDRYPVTLEDRLVGSVLAVSGVVMIGILTARISSYFLEQALKAGRGVVDTDRLEDHFVVCGWKEEMHMLLSHILDFNPGLKATSLVVIANVPNTWIDEVRAVKRLEKVQFIVGDYFQEVSLRRAAPERARKVLILADRTPGASGQVPSSTEVDARTVMSAMTLSNIARGTLVAAEVLDPKMDQYLRLAEVSEVIYSNQYSRLLLSNASRGTGVTNILFDLIDPSTPTLITTEEIEDAMLGCTYGELKKKLEGRDHRTVLIGILENTGNRHRIKEQALRQAQKTPDVRRLVENLRAVKEIRCNYPIFNPEASYVLQEGSLAIVLSTRTPERHPDVTAS